MKLKLTALITLVSLASLAFAGAALADPGAAGPEPNGAAGAGQGVLQFKSLDSELTIAYAGRGYNLHRNSTLDLPVNPGVHNFDFFCGTSKQFVGGIKVEAGKTTTVTLEPKSCIQPIVEGPAAPSGPTAAQRAYTDGYNDGVVCTLFNTSYSSDPAIMVFYGNGHGAGWTAGGC